MKTILSRIVLPAFNEVSKSDLYYHANEEVVLEQGVLHFVKGGKIRLDTYFNAFVYPKYLAYTSLQTVLCSVCVQGEVVIKAICCNGFGEERKIFEQNIIGVGQDISLPAIYLASLPETGMLFLEIEAISEKVSFIRGCYETLETPANDVNIAVVICTFHREEYVKRNLKQIQKVIWDSLDCPCGDSIYVYVIDNGHTLLPETNEHFQILHNKNLGGSGGFTRGFIEAYRSGDRFTHVLFMDDDISFEAEILIKTVQILRYAKVLDRPLCIGGQMLEEDNPIIQFESGAFYQNGRLIAVNRGLDLTKKQNLLINCKEYHVQYNAWWYCCLPLELADEIGLSLPFFIKSDDVEYGLRMKSHIMLMNGIGVWHQAFSQKYSSHLEYYIKRNELIVSAIYDNGAGILPSVWKLVRAAGKAILFGEPKAVNFMLLAYRDFLSGPDFFRYVDGEKLNCKLLQMREKKSKARIISFFIDPFRLLPMIIKLAVKYKHLQRQYKESLRDLTSIEAWCKRLEID